MDAAHPHRSGRSDAGHALRQSWQAVVDARGGRGPVFGVGFSVEETSGRKTLKTENLTPSTEHRATPRSGLAGA